MAPIATPRGTRAVAAPTGSGADRSVPIPGPCPARRRSAARFGRALGGGPVRMRVVRRLVARACASDNVGENGTRAITHG